MNTLIDVMNSLAGHWWSLAVNVTWQASLLGLAALALVGLGRRWPSPLRYGLLALALVKFVLPPMLPSPTGVFSRFQALGAPAAVPAARTAGVTLPAARESAPDTFASSTRTAGASTMPRSAPADGWDRPGDSAAARAALDARALFMALHLLGALCVALWVGRQWALLSRARRVSVCLPGGALHREFSALAARMGVRRVPQLYLSPLTAPPMAFGLWRSVVMIPSGTATASLAERRAILAHELAHCRRGDVWANWAQLALAALWWFNPVVWALNRAVRRVREDCCDDLLLAQGLTRQTDYCDALLRCAARLTTLAPAGAAIGFAERLHPLSRRLRRIMDGAQRRSARLGAAGAAALALFAAAALPGVSSGERLPRASASLEIAPVPAPPVELAQAPAATPAPVPPAPADEEPATEKIMPARDMTPMMATPATAVMPATALTTETATSTSSAAAAKADPAAMRARMDEAKNYYKRQDYRRALEAYRAILADDPGNDTARRFAERCEQRLAEARQQAGAVAAGGKAREIDQTFDAAMAAYKAGRILEAVAGWQRVLELDPRHRLAGVYLAETRQQAEAARAAASNAEVGARAEATAADMLQRKVSIEVDTPTPLAEFIKSLAILADFKYNIVSGGEIPVQGRFVDMRVSDLLTQILGARAMRWAREGDMITIQPDLRLRVFRLETQEVAKVQALLADGTLQRMLWGPSGHPPTPGAEIRYDERLQQLVVTDSPTNLSRIERLIAELRVTRPPSYETKIYKVRADESAKVKTLLNALLELESADQTTGRKIIVDGEDLIIKDSPENLQRAEELLADRQMLSNLRVGQIDIGKWNLTPRDIAQQDSSALRSYFANVVEVIETMLYSRTGKDAAAGEGRRLWADPSLLSITMTDTRDNINRVGEYIGQLEILEPEERSKIVFLKHADAADMAGQLRDVLGLEGSTGTAGGAESITRTLRDGDDFTWKDLRVRLVRVEENDVDDENDDSAEFVLRTSTSQEDPTIEEFRSENITDANGEYEISVLDVDPSGTQGEGRARIEIFYYPAMTAAAP